jgi:uncharacterized protein (UPF0333 family)
MWVNLGFRLGFLTFLVLMILVSSGTYFLYTKFTEGNIPLKIESASGLVSNSKSNAEKNESTADSFLRDEKEKFFKRNNQ